MDKKTKAKETKSESVIENELGPLVKAIDDAVASIVDADQREEVREAVSQAVHGAIRQLSRPSGRSVTTLDPPPIGEVARTATDVISRVKDMGFVEFTAGLINGTFDAIISATLKQMQAYADLVASLAKTLTEFQAENVSVAQITAYLATQFPDGSGGTSVRTDYKFKDTPEDPSTGAAKVPAFDKLKLVGSTLVKDTASVVDTDGKPLLSFSDEPDSADYSGTSFSSAWVAKARDVVGKLLAKTMIEHLRAMAREGMARIVITNGQLLSKLTFRVDSSESASKTESDYNSSQFSATLGARYGTRHFGATLGLGYGSMKVSTVNTESFDTLTMSAEIIGQVQINFRTETFAPVVKDGPIAG